MEVLLVLIFYLGIAVAVLGLALRIFPKKLPDIRFTATSPEYAYSMVGQFASGTFENRFGYPTGFYWYDEDRSAEPHSLVMTEAQPTGSITDGAAAAVAVVGGDVATSGGLMGCFMGLMILFIGMPFMIVSALDRVFRWAMKSKVEVSFQLEGEDTIASMQFRGPSGYLVASRYQRVFGTPELPESLAPAEPATTSADSQPVEF